MIGAALSLEKSWLKSVTHSLQKSLIKLNSSDWKKRMELSMKFKRNDQFLFETIQALEKMRKNSPDSWGKALNGSNLSLSDFHAYLERMHQDDFSAEQGVYIHSSYISEEKRLDLMKRYDEHFYLLEGVMKQISLQYA